MRPLHYLPLLLMIHGVNSTLEWSATVMSVLRPHFQCRLVRYRYFHTLWGPLKVYIWPVMLLLILVVLILLATRFVSWLLGQPGTIWDWTDNLFHARDANAVALWLVTGLLALETWVVVDGERQWARHVDRTTPCWWPPVVLGLVGLGGAAFGGHPWQWAFPVGALGGVAVFLDLREYPSKPLSPTTLFALPCVVLVLIAGVVYYLLAGRTAPAWWALYAFALLLVLVLVGVAEAIVRGHLAFARVRTELLRGRRQFPRPFVVAHSLGTYLTGHILHETYELHLGRVVFTGSVLDQDYPWSRVALPPREGLIALTNYVGRSDWVPMLTGWARGLWLRLMRPLRRPRLTEWIEWLGRQARWRPLGMAGFAGFRPHPDVVHTHAPGGACRACADAGVRVCVHNVDHDWAEHSTLNQSRSFQSWSWLPCLWGISTDEFEDWIDICRLGHFHGQPKLDENGEPAKPYEPQDTDGFRAQERRLITSAWCWPASSVEPTPVAGQSLEVRVADILKDDPQAAGVPLDSLMKRLPKFIFDRVTEAWEQAEDLEGEDPDKLPASVLQKLRLLRPQEALRHAVAWAVQIQQGLAAAPPPAAIP
jgi:hypothetical protein